MQKRITDRLIKSLEATEKTYEVVDTDIKGFTLIVRPSGVLSFCYRYTNAEGVKKSYTLGRYGTITTTMARDLAELRAAEVKTGIDIQAAKKTTRAKSDKARQQTLTVFFTEHYKPYSTKQMKSGTAVTEVLKTQFVNSWGNLSLTAITPLLINDWKNKRLEKGLKPASINRPLTYLKALLNRAVEWGVIDTNPLAKLKKLKEDDFAKVRYLKPDEEIQLIKALEEREGKQRAERLRYIEWCRQRHLPMPLPHEQRFTDYLMPLVLLALHTGMRRGELFGLQWGFVDFDHRTVTIQGAGAKSGQTRHIPLNDKVLSVLTDWSQQNSDAKPTDLVFPSPVTRKLLMTAQN